MAEERKSGQERRALLMMFRPRFERNFPASGHDATDQEMLCLLKKADRRRVIASHDHDDKKQH